MIYKANPDPESNSDRPPEPPQQRAPQQQTPQRPPAQPPIKRKRRKRRRIALLIAVVLVGAVFLGGLSAVLSNVLLKKKEPALPPLERDPFVIQYGSEEIPVIEDVPENPYAAEAFKMTEGLMVYNSDTVTTYTGIDVSSHQDEIDWQAVKDAGIDFAILRAGYRGYTEGGLFLDNRFIYNINKCNELDIPVGIYFYSQAISVEEAREEAELVLKWIRGYDVDYPIVFDWEHVGDPEARTNDVPGDVITDCAIEFCSIIEANGYKPMIYFNQELAYKYYDLSRICYFDFWLAEPNEKAPTFYYDFQIFQYTHYGTVDGIAKEVDINLSFIDYTKEN